MIIHSDYRLGLVEGCDDPPGTELFLSYSSSNATSSSTSTLRQLINQRRRAKWSSFCEQMASGDYTKAISRISRIRKYRTVKSTPSTPESPQHAVNMMASDLGSTFSGDLLREVQRYEIITPILPCELDCPNITYI
jgi:hypothetical protein